MNMIHQSPVFVHYEQGLWHACFLFACIVLSGRWKQWNNINFIYIGALKTEFTKCFESFKQKKETQEYNVIE